jgi:hypothetical protein
MSEVAFQCVAGGSCIAPICPEHARPRAVVLDGPIQRTCMPTGQNGSWVSA